MKKILDSLKCFFKEIFKKETIEDKQKNYKEGSVSIDKILNKK